MCICAACRRHPGFASTPAPAGMRLWPARRHTAIGPDRQRVNNGKWRCRIICEIKVQRQLRGDGGSLRAMHLFQNRPHLSMPSPRPASPRCCRRGVVETGCDGSENGRSCSRPLGSGHCHQAMHPIQFVAQPADDLVQTRSSAVANVCAEKTSPSTLATVSISRKPGPGAQPALRSRLRLWRGCCANRRGVAAPNPHHPAR